MKLYEFTYILFSYMTLLLLVLGFSNILNDKNLKTQTELLFLKHHTFPKPAFTPAHFDERYPSLPGVMLYFLFFYPIVSYC